MSRVETLFAAAVELPNAAQREVWLRQQCPDDPEAVTQVIQLLRSADLEATEQRAAVARVRPAASATAVSERTIGTYRLERTLGSGGMGTVYLAHREGGDIEQTVAIKVLSDDAANEQFLRYFREERQILAKLVHPNVTRFLDSGTTPDGAPYLVMEYVDGEPLHRWQDARSLDLPARLALFRKICAAVTFLHQNLILHRDLKPSNILVTAGGEPKLLDFGAAKALAQSDKTVTMAPLTPRYASPEQVLGKLVTTQSDVYALGVILYEMMTGAWPFGDPDSAGNAMGRFFGSAKASDPATVVTEEAAKVRGVAAPALRATLAADLGRIVTKAIEYEPAERYESVAALSEDVRRYLDHEPVLAQSQTAGYRLRKFVRRNALAVAAGAVFVLGISAAAGIAIWEAREARAATARAEQRFQDVRKLTRLVLVRFYDEVAKMPGGMELQQSLIQQTIEQFETLVKESNRDPEILAEVGEGYLRMAALQGNQYANNKGDVSGSVAIYRKGIALLSSGAPAEPVEVVLGQLHRGLGRTLFAKGESTAALEELDRSVARFESALRKSPSLDTEVELMYTRTTIADFVLDFDPKRALAQYEAAVPIVEKANRDGKATQRNGILFYKLGAAHELLGDLAAAVELYRKGLAENDRLPEKERMLTVNRRARASLLSVLGSGLAVLGRSQEAGPHLDESAAIARAMVAADPSSARARYSLAANLNNRSAAYRQMGSPERTHAALVEEAAAWDALLEKSPVPMYESAAATNFDSVSQSFATRGDREKARQYASRSIALLGKVTSAKPSPEDRRRYAAVLLEAGAQELRNPRLALEQVELAMKQSSSPPPAMWRTYGVALLRNGRFADAAAAFEKTIAMMAPKKGSPESADLVQTREWLRQARAAK
ncbi:MAG: serine/threonine-protein kinase [Bryobacteraceae bacterium]